MFWPQLIGDVEIEERRPRYWNEPRRKRLNFVRERTRGSNEWALVPAPGGRHHYESEQELWDRRQWDAQNRFLAQEGQRLRQRQERLRMDHERLMLHQHPPLHPCHDPRIQQLPPVPPQQHGGHPEHGTEDNRHRHGHGSHDAIEVLSDSGNSDDDRSRSPILIELEPPEKLPKEFKHHRSKSRGRKEKKRMRLSSLLSDDSSSEDDSIQVYRVKRTTSLSGRPVSRRGRSRSRLFELSDDSFEDLELRPARSRSRGARHSRHSRRRG